MKRAVVIVLLLAFALAALSTTACEVVVEDADKISSLDICSHGVADISDGFITLIEPAFDIHASMHCTGLPAEKPFIYEYAVFPPIDEPPVA